MSSFIERCAPSAREPQLGTWVKLPSLETVEILALCGTFTQIEQTVNELGALGTRFEFECYDVGHLYTLAHFAERGLVQPPFWIQTIFGILGGIGADQDNLTHMVRVADRLFGTDYVLSAFAAGHHQMDFITASAFHGGHVRVGLEDCASWAERSPRRHRRARCWRFSRRGYQQRAAAVRIER